MRHYVDTHFEAPIYRKINILEIENINIEYNNYNEQLFRTKIDYLPRESNWAYYLSDSVQVTRAKDQ